MDNICLHCHEAYAHQRPNMRVECRANCFKTHIFSLCLKMHNPGAPTNLKQLLQDEEAAAAAAAAASEAFEY